MAREEAVSSELLTAVEEGDLDAVYRLCGDGQVSVTNKVTKATSCSPCHCDCLQHGESALHIAAGYGQLDMVRVLLESGASINFKDKVSTHPATMAVSLSHVTAARRQRTVLGC